MHPLPLSYSVIVKEPVSAGIGMKIEDLSCIAKAERSGIRTRTVGGDIYALAFTHSTNQPPLVSGQPLRPGEFGTRVRQRNF